MDKFLGVVGLAVLSAVAPACAQQFDTSRTLPARGTVGEEMFGVICDRVAAQALREDLTGASFHDLCHKPKGGDFADKVDQSKLPAIDPAAVDEHGKHVSTDDQRASRDKAVARVEALARRRADLVRAFDATFPEESIGIKDLENADEKKSCNPPKKSGEGTLTSELARMLGKTADLYNDGTIPQSTESLARVIDTFKRSEEAQSAWSRISARNGYRPIDTALGTARPVIAYPNLRDLANASLRLLSADSVPYQLDPKFDADGNRIPVPGPGNAALNKMLEAGHEELLAVTADPLPPALKLTTDAQTGRIVLSRPRDNLEMMQELLYFSDPAFGGGSELHYIVRRDPRGFAAIAGGVVPAPLVDADKDGLPDVDDVGRFKTSDGSLAPTPFPYSGTDDNSPRDGLGRALVGGKVFYDYLDTSHTFAAQMMSDLKPLVNADPSAQHETLMDTLGGVYVALGPRTKTSKSYAGTGKVVEYDGIDVKASPMLDLIYAMGVILADRNTDATLQMAKELVSKHEMEIARLAGALEASFDVAQKHPEAKIPKASTFWDESLDTMAKIAKEPGLLEDVLRALADPATEQLGPAFSRYAKYKDELSYDKSNLNGAPFNLTTGNTAEMNTPVDRSQPETGKNRSALYRFLGLISDTIGVTACNKPDAQVHASLFGINVTMPLLGSYGECEVFKIDNLGAFYLDSIAEGYQYDASGKPNKRGAFYLRDDLLRTGIAGIGAATVGLMEDSSGLTGFWTPTDSTVLAAKPAWLNRLVFFDLQGDSPNSGDPNYKTNHFIADMQGLHGIGTSVCPERTLPDPKPSAPDASPDGIVHGLRNCPDGMWLDQRGHGTIFTWENFGFYDAIKPLLGAFVKHGREDLFLELSASAYKHMPGAEASQGECLLPGAKTCPKDGGDTYEPLLVEAFATDLFGGLGEIAKALDQMSLNRCDAADKTGACTKTTAVTGIDVAAAATRAMIDPDYARTSLKLVDRNGNVTAKRNDGTTNPQVTPAYLLTAALSGIDDAFDAWEAAHPDDKDRRANWRRARSQLVDQFMGVVGQKSTSKFGNPAMSKMGPVLIDLLRSQLLAHCPTSFTPPYDPCPWAKTDLVNKATDSLGGPLVSAGLEMMDAIRRDPEGRKQMELLLAYMVDAASQNDALPSMLASSSDILQVLRDDTNVVPLLHVAASAMDASVTDQSGKVTQKSLVDAQTALLARLSGKYFDKDGVELCSREVDPNQVLTVALGHLVTPIKDGAFKGQTPLEVIIDVIADVNRVDPTQPYEGTLVKDDYAYVTDQVYDFLMNRERGMEQFYEVIRQGTRF